MCNETLLTMVICHVHSIMIISLLNEKSNTIVQNNSYFLEKYYRYLDMGWSIMDQRSSMSSSLYVILESFVS